MASKHIMILAGDGIGPEVCAEAERLLGWLSARGLCDFTIEHGLIGGVAYDDCGESLSDTTLAAAMSADAVLLGAVGAPQYDNVERDKRPEAGLLKIRKRMDLFANLRPALVFEPLVAASSLKPDIVSGLDILIVRELTGGVYFGEPRGMQAWQGGERCVDTQAYNRHEIERLARAGFELARQRSGRVHSVEKANVMETGKFWRDVVSALHAVEFSDIELQHMYADNCAMQLVRAPKQFDVILTDNLFGDILSDTAAMCTGSLGMLPSASLGVRQPDGKMAALYEPVHGSAPDIAGKNCANPLAMLLSVAMMLKYSFGYQREAKLVEQAIHKLLDNGLRTADIIAAGCKEVSTETMGLALLAELEKLHNG